MGLPDLFAPFKTEPFYLALHIVTLVGNRGKW
jgi:hypothetical protein